jgi:TonB family protein
MANGTAAAPLPFRVTANDRLKGSFNDWFWGSLAAAAIIHGILLAFWPQMTIEDVGIRSTELAAIDPIQEIEIPPPPEQIVRPAVPVLSTDINIQDDITIAPTTFEENTFDNLPPPPSSRGVDLSAAPAFTPYDVRPELRDRSGFQRILERNYPPILRDAGIGGTVVVHVFIDENGSVRNTRIHTSSGRAELDRAAEATMQQATFRPARNRDQVVPVWIALPVTFRTQ